MAADPQGSAHDRARIVRRYLSALDARKPGRSNVRTQELIALRMHQVDIDLMSADPLTRLHLTQERIDLHAEQLRLNAKANDFAELERAFTRVARGYGERNDITFSAWRQVGVEADVLAKAGITQHVRPARPEGAAPAAKADEPQPAKYKPAQQSAAQKPAAKKQDAPKPPPAPKPEAPKAEAPNAEAPKAEAPKAEAPAPAPAAKKQQQQPAKKAPAAKKAPVAKKAPANGAKKQSAPKPAQPQQQQLPAEVHLLG
jgi:hypothetical protein